MLLDGYNEVNECNEDVKIHTSKIKEVIENSLGETFEIFEPIFFTCQVDFGYHYKVKIHVGDQRFIHVRFFAPFPSSSLGYIIFECKSGKTLFDPLP